ncbi:MlaA family lipoprotein [Sphingobium phenoxybenzoativorans]|uniref:MlaA family lipoprotein n=1 Tax=Sphingobium phenoxybenzoativorans TaxID=1592790 RepID=UPI00209B750B|nr:VacJ family lipoprotein [Sphingobium phenoxybenzoativorans]
MSILVFTTAMLLAGAQLNSADSPLLAPVLPMVSIESLYEDEAPSGFAPGAGALAVSEVAVPAESMALASDSDMEQNEIVVQGRRHEPTPGDPLESFNAQSYEITQDVDKVIVAPAAMAYRDALPAPVRSGIRNFFNNLAEPIVFLNFLLQIKPGKAVETLGRFAINTTIGGAGLLDMAKRRPFNLPLRRNGFANSMGYYGIKTGAFLYLPLIGPTTVRDLIGLTLDKLVLPVAIGKPFNQPYYSIPSALVGTIDYRVEFDAELRRIREESADPYAASRDNYLRSRQAEIDELRGIRPAMSAPDGVTSGTGPLVQPVLPPAEPAAPAISGKSAPPNP